jgi:NADH-quinone oxidoreductase subunit N
MTLLDTPAIVIALALVLLGVLASVGFGAADIKRGLRPLIIALFALAIAVFAFFPIGGSALSGMLAVDAFTAFFAILFLLVAIITILGLESPTPTALASVCLATVGMTLAAGARDLLLLYLAIELSSAPLYALLAAKRTARRLEAATKYFIVSIISSALLLLGVVLLAVPAGTTRIASLASLSGPLALLGAGLFLAGLSFKLGVWPFNLWVPDVYELGPTEIAGFLAGASKKAAFAGLLRASIVLIPLFANWTLAIAILAALTMTIPNLIALAQEDTRRLVAYSSITHAGYLLMGVAVASTAGYAALSLHALAHATLVVGAFLCLGVFAANRLHKVEEYAGLARRSPYLAGALTLFLLGLAGMPLLSGFWSKLYLFTESARAGLVWLVVLGILNSVIALYYYFRIIRAMYDRDAAGRTILVRTTTLWAVALCLIVTLVIGLWPGPFLHAATVAAGALG